MRNQIKRLTLPLLVLCLAIPASVIPDIVSDEMKAWCLANIGPSYPRLLIGFFVLASVVLAVLQSDWGKGLFPSSKGKALNSAKIPWSPQTAQIVQEAREVLIDAKPEEALSRLYDLKSAGLDEKLSMLSIKLAEYRQSSGIGTLTSEQKETIFSRISKAILDLIKQIENQLAEGQKENQQLRDAFRKRYNNRLSQKLASRQPVNLRRYATTEGTSDPVADTFIAYNSEEIKEEISKTFQDARGRLLIVGQPGAGKTTLLLQLADRLFDLQEDALPVVLNLATWQSSFGKLETWLEAVMAAELSTNKASAKIVLRQSNLILLLDGLDELKEDEAINSCLVAIANYGAVADRRFVVTCRIDDYKRVQEDARVRLQIEVGPLQTEQLEAELARMEDQPEALPMLQAIKKDPLLRQAVETPFYFNTLQLLFAGRLPVFTIQDLESRESEIKETFVAFALQDTKNKSYPPESSKRWLSFLASRMNKRNMVVFELRDLQYDWWWRWTWWNEIVASLINGLVVGLVAWLAFWLVAYLVLSLVAWLLNGLFIGLLDMVVPVLVYPPVFGLLEGLLNGLFLGWTPKIITKDAPGWSLKSYIKSLKSNFFNAFSLLVWTVPLMLVWMLVILPTDTVGVLGMLAAAPVSVLVGGLAAALVGVLVGVLAAALVEMIKYKFSDFIQINTPYQRFKASMKVLHFSILQHWHLLYLLSKPKRNLLPYDLVPFLNEMTARNLLESDGATWRFRHRLIQDWFAEEWEKQQATTNQI